LKIFFGNITEELIGEDFEKPTENSNISRVDVQSKKSVYKGSQN